MLKSIAKQKKSSHIKSMSRRVLFPGNRGNINVYGPRNQPTQTNINS